MVQPTRSLYVIQHTDAEYLGHLEDHLEGRNIRFTYMRPHTADGKLPATVKFTDGMILLGGGPWGAAGTRNLPSLDDEIQLVKQCMLEGAPVIGIGIGAQVLALASGGSVEAAPLAFDVQTAHRTDPDALNGFLPEIYPMVTYMRDQPVAPPHGRVLSETEDGGHALFQVAENCFGFAGHPGIKLGMIEDLIMEFDESPDDIGAGLDKFRAAQTELVDALVPIMTGLIQLTGWMDGRHSENMPQSRSNEGL